MSQIERRFCAVVPELRVESEGGAPKIVGYAAMFNTRSLDLGGFIETIRPGAFARALKEGQDVRALVDHESSRIIGRSTAGTLRMKEDDKGLMVEIDPPDTSVGRDILVSMKRGDVTQMSFQFRTVADEWRMEDRTALRELIDVDLYDVSPVTFPAYPDTSVAVRSMAKFLSTRARDTMATRIRIATMS